MSCNGTQSNEEIFLAGTLFQIYFTKDPLECIGEKIILLKPHNYSIFRKYPSYTEITVSSTMNVLYFTDPDCENSWQVAVVGW